MKTQRPAGELERHAVAALDDALGGDRHQRSVRALDFGGAVDRGRALHQVRRIDHVPGAARMNDEARSRQLRHQQPDASGVVEVDVGRDDEVDRVALESGGGERREQARHRVVRAGVDEGGAAAFDDQIGGVEQRPVKPSVDDVDAVRQRFDEVRRCRRGGIRVGHEGVACRARSAAPILESAFGAGTRARVQNSARRTPLPPETNP